MGETPGARLSQNPRARHLQMRGDLVRRDQRDRHPLLIELGPIRRHR
jgi:hypothetical protein